MIYKRRAVVADGYGKMQFRSILPRKWRFYSNCCMIRTPLASISRDSISTRHWPAGDPCRPGFFFSYHWCVDLLVPNAPRRVPSAPDQQRWACPASTAEAPIAAVPLLPGIDRHAIRLLDQDRAHLGLQAVVVGLGSCFEALGGGQRQPAHGQSGQGWSFSRDGG